MSTAEAKLRELVRRAPRSGDELLTLLRDGLDWPVRADFVWTDIQLDWDPVELHLDPAKVAKLTQISQLPKLTQKQDFGVFVLAFEDGSLPIGAIRRVVDRLVRNQRARTSTGSHPQWALNDLLFFCLSDSRQPVLHVVNFRQSEGKRVLRVLSWDDAPSSAKLDLIVQRALPDLRWSNDSPALTLDLNTASAFGGYRESIKSAAALATRMAQVARDVKDDVLALYEVETDDGPMRTLHREFRSELIADLTPERFADVYAQSMVYGLLSARIAHPEAFASENVSTLVEFENPLLNAIYRRFRQDSEKEIDLDELGLADLSAQLNATDVESVLAEFGAKNKRDDPVVHFYEEFLSKFDPKARISAGAFYTPLPVVRYLVRAVDSALKDTFGLPLGVADAGTWGEVCSHLGIDVPKGIEPKSRFVSMLDPATGTGTFLVEWVRQAERSFKEVHPKGNWAAHLRDVVFPGMHAFELMLAPYAIAHLRMALAAKEYGVTGSGPTILLTDSLEYPSDQILIPEYSDPVAIEGERAASLKREARFTIVMGNPPYERERKAKDDSAKRKGGVVRFGTAGVPALLEPLTRAMSDAGLGRVMKGLHNIYVYFWRLATWRTSERPSGPGIVAFITGSSYLDGVGLGGLRAHMRGTFDELHVLDLGGEGRGPNKEDNVFDILTPVAIAIGLRVRGDADCQVNYARVQGSRAQKLEWLDEHDLVTPETLLVEGSGLDALRPHNKPDAKRWPLSVIFPWTGRGIQFSRSWPVAETAEVVKERWNRLIFSPKTDRATLLKESRDVQILREYPSFLSDRRLSPLAGEAGLSSDSICRVGYRSFDTQWCVADRRVIDMPRPALWRSLSDKQIYFTGLSDESEYTTGPVLVPQVWVPDLNSFNNRGGLVYPLFADAEGQRANLHEGLANLLSESFSVTVQQVSIAEYVYGLLGTGAYLRAVGVDSVRRSISVPITLDRGLFDEVAAHGRTLLWHATGGLRGTRPAVSNDCAVGAAKVIRSIGPTLPSAYSYDESSGELIVGDGIVGPVGTDVWSYEVSGFRVVSSWLSYRLANRSGKKSSSLDDIRPKRWELTVELLELLRSLQGIIRMEPIADEFVRRVLTSDLLSLDRGL